MQHTQSLTSPGTVFNVTRPESEQQAPPETMLLPPKRQDALTAKNNGTQVLDHKNKCLSILMYIWFASIQLTSPGFNLLKDSVQVLLQSTNITRYKNMV